MKVITNTSTKNVVWEMQGYKAVMETCAANAKYVEDKLVETGKFKILSKSEGVPLVAFALKDKSQIDEYEIADRLRQFGFIVPAYTMAPDAQVKEGMEREREREGERERERGREREEEIGRGREDGKYRG